MIKFDIITIFPGMFQGPLTESILQKAIEKKLVEIALHDLRDYTHDRHRVVDDAPYGGGPGMIMKPEPICEAVETLKAGSTDRDNTELILMTPQGQLLDHRLVSDLAAMERCIIICGHYGGVDERVTKLLHPLEISIGDYVLSGGEIPAMVLIDAVSRMIPGVVGSTESVEKDCFYQGFLSYPQYTRPEEFNSIKVPRVLTSGDHAKIDKWRKKQAFLRTMTRRPDLFSRIAIEEKDILLMREPDNDDEDRNS